MPRPRARTPEQERAHPRVFDPSIKELLGDIKRLKQSIDRSSNAIEELEQKRGDINQAGKSGKSVTIFRTSGLSEGLTGAPTGLASTRHEDKHLIVQPKDFPRLLHNITNLLQTNQDLLVGSRKRLFGKLYEYRERMPIHHKVVRVVQKKIRNIRRIRAQRK